MANHKSSLKRIRQEETRRLHNRYYGKTMRNAVRKLRATTDKAEATVSYEPSSYSGVLSEAALPQPEHSISTVPTAHTVSNFKFIC